MKVICAWCEKVLVNGPPDKVTHTICEKCKEKQLKLIKK